MKSTTILAIAASTVVSVATAEVLKYGAPIASTVWTAGQDATISWTNTCTGATTAFPVMLQLERADGVQEPVPGVPSLGNLDCAKAGSLTVKVPTTVASGSKYSILVNSPEQSYSALFTIKNAAMPDPAAATTTTGTAAPTGTSTSAGSSSSATNKPSVTISSSTTSPSATTKPNNAGALKTGSAAALAVAGAVAALIF